MKIFKIVCNVLVIILIVVMAVLASIMIVPRIIGYDTMAVLSGSMEPKIPVGSIVFVKECVSDEYKVDDVVTYELGDGKTRVTHRIVEINEKEHTLITKGDANDTEDAEPVAYDSVVGKMKCSLPLLGYATIYVKTPLGIAAACGIIIILLFLIYLPEILSEDEKSKKNN